LVEKGGLVVKKRIRDFLMDMKWLESSINGGFFKERRKGMGCLASAYPFGLTRVNLSDSWPDHLTGSGFKTIVSVQIVVSHSFSKFDF
jgi:hypothetical protein